MSSKLFIEYNGYWYQKNVIKNLWVLSEPVLEYLFHILFYSDPLPTITLMLNHLENVLQHVSTVQDIFKGISLKTIASFSSHLSLLGIQVLTASSLTRLINYSINTKY